MKNRHIISDLIFLSIILFLAVSSFVRYERIIKLNKEANLVVHTNFIKLKLTETNALLHKLENKAQDSIQLNPAAFSHLLFQDSSETSRKLVELDSLTHDNSQQQTRIHLLAGALGDLFRNLHGENEQASDLSADLPVFAKRGQTILHQMDSLIGEMTTMGDGMLLERIQEKDRSALLTPVYSLVFSFLAILIVTVVYFRLRKETQLRRQAEDARAIIHNFFHQAPVMLAILKGPTHIFEFINQPLREMIGGRNPVNIPIREAIPEAAGQGYFEILDSVYQTGTPYIGREMPVQIEGENGLEQLYITFICQTFKNQKGEKEGILTFCYDVSEQVLARNKLQEAENRSRLAIEAARMGTFDWDLQNQQFISSERLVEIFGYHDAGKVSHQDLIGRLHPEDKPIRDEAINNSYITGSLKYEARILWPDKSIHWINVYGKIFSDENRNIRRMYGTVVDITPQKIVLEEIKESESKFRLLANAMPQKIWTTDSNGNPNYFNQAFYDYTGLNFSELENKGWMSIIHPEELEENIKIWAESVATGNEFFFEHRFRNFKGEYRWHLSRAIPQKDHQGNIQMWIGTSTDIEDQKNFVRELEKKVFERTQSLNYTNLALKQTVSELELTNSELASFNYIASHDLQEPLRKIIAFSKRIEDVEQQALSETSKDYFNRIIQATYRMQNLIDAFLSYSQTSNFQASYERTDFNRIFRDVRNEFADTISQKNISLECGQLPELMAIPLQINQLFINLIGNSIKYTRPGVQSKIEIYTEVITGWDLQFEGADGATPYRKISIRDNGIGFDQIYENQIFEPFQRLHSRQEYAGTGIGLAICKKIMRNHKGFISASGQTGSGAIFSMYFPF